MANVELLGSASSQSTLLLLRRPISKLSLSTRTPPLHFSCNLDYPTLAASSKRISSLAGVASSDSIYSAVIADTVDSAKGRIEIEPDIGGGGGGGGGGVGGGGEGKGESSDESGKKKEMGMSMYQILTLGYAAFVRVGGLMGFLKSGSPESLLTGVAALMLCFVYTPLSMTLVLAFSIGLGLAVAFLGVMGVMMSGMVFPADVVSFAFLVITAGYLHGILSSLH